MLKHRVRPVFVRPLPVEPGAFFRALDSAQEDGGLCRVCVFEGGAILRIRESDRHFWSPALHLHVQFGADGPELHGRFSPSSPIWTAFLASYLALGCIAVASACYGCAQLTVDATPWAFVGVPAAFVTAGFVYGAAFIGQGFGAEDMYELRSFVDHVAESFALGVL
ncbi:MAG: hypothetical protein KDB80_16300 [Planctomycetes bacterium]|nr:hypothetical protein [Planctomycetota bacterium]